MGYRGHGAWEICKEGIKPVAGLCTTPLTLELFAYKYVNMHGPDVGPPPTLYNPYTRCSPNPVKQNHHLVAIYSFVWLNIRSPLAFIEGQSIKRSLYFVAMVVFLAIFL
jgi:hypothetical protein